MLVETANSTGGSWSSGSGQFTFAGQSIGTAASDRLVIGVFTFERGTVSAATIGGQTATIDAQGQSVGGVAGSCIVSAVVASGTTADFVFSMDQNPSFKALTVFTLAGGAVVDGDGSTDVISGTTATTGTISSAASGFSVGGSFLRTSGTCSITDQSEAYTTETNGRSHFHGEGATDGTSQTYTATWSASQATSISVATYEVSGGGSTSVTPADTTQATSATSPSVTSVAVVAPNDGVHATSATQPIVSSAASVSPADASHSVTSTQPAVSSLAIVSPDDAVNDNTATSPVISQPGFVSPADATHVTSATSPAVASPNIDGLEPLADAVPFKRRRDSSPRETIESIMRPPPVVVREEPAENPVVQEAAERQQEFEDRIAALRVRLERARATERIESIQAQIIEIEERAEAERIAQLQWVEDEAAALLLLAAA